MRRFRLLLLALVAVAGAGCASEGGVTGTGISASVSGNVVVVSDAATAATLPFAIRVTVDQDPAASAVTDSEGTFVIEGTFAGAVTLRFARADAGDEIGPLALEVPAGSATVLENIVIRTGALVGERVQPLAVRQLDAVGRIELVECGADGTGALLIADDARPPRQFMIGLDAGTEIVTRDGAERACADLALRATVRVEGLLRLTDQTLSATRVVLEPGRSPRPPVGEPRAERLRGSVAGVDCVGGTIEVAQPTRPEPTLRRVRLDEDTAITCSGVSGRPCDCADIAVGDDVAVSGLIHPDRPGVVLAEVVTVGNAAVPLSVTGRLTRIGCAAGVLVLQDEAFRRVLRVRLIDATEVRCGRRPCSCVALAARDRVRVEGPLRAGPPAEVEAVRIIRLTDSPP